jgi:hypothetical protein
MRHDLAEDLNKKCNFQIRPTGDGLAFLEQRLLDEENQVG